MNQERDVNKKNLDPDQKGQVVDEVDAQLILPDSHRAQGVDQQVEDQECPDREDAGQGMQLEDKEMCPISGT